MINTSELLKKNFKIFESIKNTKQNEPLLEYMET